MVHSSNVPRKSVHTAIGVQTPGKSRSVVQVSFKKNSHVDNQNQCAIDLHLLIVCPKIILTHIFLNYSIYLQIPLDSDAVHSIV